MPGEGRNLMVVGHPGHELRAYGWIADTRPRVCILTDGGGSANASRLNESVSLLNGLGAHIGPICGAWSDRRLYEIILAGECASLVRSAEQLAELMIDDRIDTVVCDAIEGYNPTHDLCGGVDDRRGCARRLARSPPTAPRVSADGRSASLAGTRPCTGSGASSYRGAVRRKKASNLELRLNWRGALPEIVDTLRRFGDDAFRCERWFAGASVSHPWADLFGGGRPFYEEYGERQVASGRFDFVVRFTEHVLPIFRHLCSLSTQAVDVTPHARALH
jgi:hypothetical protein